MRRLPISLAQGYRRGPAVAIRAGSATDSGPGGNPAMTPDAILAHPPRVLTQAHRERYFATGYLAAEGVISPRWLARLQALSAEFIEASKQHRASNEAFDLGPS